MIFVVAAGVLGFIIFGRDLYSLWGPWNWQIAGSIRQTHTQILIFCTIRRFADSTVRIVLGIYCSQWLDEKTCSGGVKITPSLIQKCYFYFRATLGVKEVLQSSKNST